jgi:hypothetical protein
MEVKDAHVLELLVNDGDDLDILGFFSFAGFEATNSPDVEFDFDSGFRCGIKSIDHFLVLQGIHFGHDAGFFAFEGAGRFFFDKADECALDLRGSGNEDAEIL